MVALLFLVGLVLLVVGAELLVRGASKLAALLGMTPLVIGLTVVAYGTSAPELAVSVSGAFSGNADVAIGNVVGSNIFNVLFILGLSSLLVPLVVDAQLVRWDVPVLIVVSFATWGFAALDGNIGRLDGALLVLGGIVYTVVAIRSSKKESAAVKDELNEAFPDPDADSTKKPSLLVQVVLILIGLVLLVIGAKLLVDAAVAIAAWLGLSPLIIGLTVVAAGTSLPEIATSVLATLRGQRDIAVGNVVGSSIFNLLAVLGLSAVFSPSGIPVAEEALAFDLPVMVAVAVATLPIFFAGHLIARWEGALFLAYYVAYTSYLVLSAQHSSWASTLEEATLFFALPLTAVTLLVFATREWRARARARVAQP